VEAVAEFECLANLAALNAVLMLRGIGAERIVAVIFEPHHYGVGRGGDEAMYRVLYRSTRQRPRAAGQST
jgi:hypothetical protein